MREIRTSGSVGAAGGKLPAANRRALAERNRKGRRSSCAGEFASATGRQCHDTSANLQMTRFWSGKTYA